MTRDEMIEGGKNVAASHVLFCTDPDDPNIYVEYVMPGQTLKASLARCTSPNVEVVKL